SPAADRLRGAYHSHGLQTALHARSLTRIVTRLRAGGVEPVLVKGLAIGRLYAERGLRPFEDLDLCVRPDQHGTASAILNDWAGEFSTVDLHRGFVWGGLSQRDRRLGRRLHAPSWDDLYSRSQMATFGGIDVRVLAPEDHLRFICLHQLRHGVPIP